MDKKTKKILCNELSADIYDIAEAGTQEQIEIALAMLIKDSVDILIDVQKDRQAAGAACMLKNIFKTEVKTNAK